MDKEELDLFLRIIGISGMGARAALNVLARLTPAQFYQAVLQQDEKLLTTVPGIGKKSAQRLLFELKDKVDLKSLTIPLEGAPVAGNFSELLEALEVLGYGRGEIMPLLMDLSARNELGGSTEENIKKILRFKALAMK
jgi:Holliday junction DNA helicase RuvA